jgi:hypothetical protein
MACLKATTDRLAREADPVFDDTAVKMLVELWPSLSSYPDQEGHKSGSVSALSLVRFNGGSWTVGDFFSRLGRTSERQRDRVGNEKDVRDLVTGLIVREQMIALALEADLEQDPDVLHQMETVYYQHRLTAWRELIADTIGHAGWDEGSLRREFEQNAELHRFPPEVNVAEVLVRTLEAAESVARDVRSGSDFSHIARTRSIRLWAAKKGGELGFGTEASYGVLGKRFFASRPGDIIGPSLSIHTTECLRFWSDGMDAPKPLRKRAGESWKH